MAETITAAKGTVQVRVTLYGDVSDERRAAEQRQAVHRADQLYKEPPAPKERRYDGGRYSY